MGRFSAAEDSNFGNGGTIFGNGGRLKIELLLALFESFPIFLLVIHRNSVSMY